MRHFCAILWVLAACTRPSYLEVQLTLPSSPVDFAHQVEWLDLAASDAAHTAGPQRIPAAPVAAGLGAVSPAVTLAVSAPSGTQVEVLINGLDGEGNPIGSASGSKTLGPGTTSLSLVLSPHCETSRGCDPNEVCSGVIGCDSQAALGYGACIDEDLGLPVAGTACGPSDAGHCDGRGSCDLPYCGDGLLDPDAGEQCDWGTANSDVLPDHCRTDCQLPHCGDGVVDPDAGEKCDLDGGHNGMGLGCNATCTLTGAVTTIAGDGEPGLVDGIGPAAEFGDPYGLALIGNDLYVADTTTRALRQLDLATARVQTLAGGNLDAGPCRGADGTGSAVSFCQIHALLVFDGGGLLISDQAALRLLAPDAELGAGVVTTLAGDIGDGGSPPVNFQAGPFAEALYANPYGMVQLGDVIYTNAHIADVLAASNLTTRQVSQVSQLTSVGTTFLGGMTSLGGLLYTSTSTSILSVDPAVSAPPVTIVAGRLSGPDGLCTDGQTIYVCMAGDQTVSQLNPSTGALSLVAGAPGNASVIDGLGADAGFRDPANCVWDPVRRALYVSDRAGQTIRMIQ